MALKFHDVFTGKGIWGFEVQGNALVDDFLIGIVKAGVSRNTRRELYIQQRFCHVEGLRTGYADNTHAATAWRRSLGNNGVGVSSLHTELIAEVIKLEWLAEVGPFYQGNGFL